MDQVGGCVCVREMTGILGPAKTKVKAQCIISLRTRLEEVRVETDKVTGKRK